MTKIIRTPTRAEGGITPEEKMRMDEHAKLWIKRALRTDPIEPDKIIPAIEGIYAAAGLKKPRVVIVPSPIVMAAAYGASAAIWRERGEASATHRETIVATHRETIVATQDATINATRNATNNATRNATQDATYGVAQDATYGATIGATFSATLIATDNATYGATDNATRNATYDATFKAIQDATYGATKNATYDATLGATGNATYGATLGTTQDATINATRNATNNATRNATFSATYDATLSATNNTIFNATHDKTDDAFLACRDIAGDFGLQCAGKWIIASQGGNMCAPWDCYLTAMRDIIGLRLPEHDAYSHWEQAAIHGGFRVMHEEFCLVCDFPVHIKMDENNEPHCEDGPSHLWRDGTAFYFWHGVQVPGHWIESRHTLDPTEVLKSKNVEQRAAGISIIGMDRMLDKLKHRVIDSDPDPLRGDLIEVEVPGLPTPVLYLKAHCPRNGTIMEAVNPAEMDECTVRGAQAWRLGIPASEFVYPTVRT